MQYCPPIRIAAAALFISYFALSACAEPPTPLHDAQTPSDKAASSSLDRIGNTLPQNADARPTKRPHNLSAPFNVGAVMDQVRNAVKENPAHPGQWAVHNLTYSATYTQDSMRFIARNPNLDARADNSPLPWATSWRTSSIQAGPQTLNEGKPTSTRAKNKVHLDWNHTRETYAHSSTGVEQSWTFTSVQNPGKHDLRIVGSLEGVQLVEQNDSGLHFKNAKPSSEHELMIAYSNATVYDASGKTIHIKPQWDAASNSISITVPAQYLAKAHWPVVVDPTFTAETGTDNPVTPTSPTTSATSTPSVAFDGTNYMVAWVEDRTGEEGSGVYATIVDNTGAVLTPTGIGVSVVGALDWGDVDVTSDGGNWYVVWTDQRGAGDPFSLRGSLVGDSDLNNITTNEVLIADGATNTDLAEASVSSDNNGFLVVYSSLENIDAQLMYTRINSSGALLDATPVILDSGPGNQSEASISGTDGRYAVIWADDGGISARAFVSGVLTPEITLEASSAFQKPAISCDKVTRTGTDHWYCTAAWMDGGGKLRGAGLEIGDLSTTTSVSAFELNGSSNNTVQLSRQGTLTVAAVNQGTDIVALTIIDDSATLDNTSFDVSSTTTIAGTGDTETLPDIALGTNSVGGSFDPATQSGIITWLNTTDNNVEGAIITNLAAGSTVVFNQRANAQSDAAVAAGPGDNYLVAWVDQRNGNNDIFAARVDVDGIVADASGITITTDAGDDKNVGVCSNGTDNFLVTWSRGADDVRAQRVSSAGALQGSTISIATSSNDVYRTDCAAISGGNYLAAWGGTDGNNAFNVGTAAITHAAGVVSNPVANVPGGDRAATFDVTASSSGFILSWIRHNNGGPGRRLAAQLFNSDGTEDGSSITLRADSFADTDTTSLVHIGNDDLAVAWTISGEIFLAFVSSDLTTVTPAAGESVETNAATDTLPQLALVDSGHVALSWERVESVTDTNILGAEALVNATDGVSLIGSTFTIADGSLLDQNPGAGGAGDGKILFAYDRFVAGEGASTLRVRATVGTFNRRPTTNTDSYTVNEDTTLSETAADGVLDNDSDPEGDVITAEVVDNVSNGSLTLSTDGSFNYTPAANFSGSDSFTYRAQDASLRSDITTVTITVDPVNDAPVAVADPYSTDEDNTLNVNAAAGVLTNDTDVDSGDTLTAVLDSGVSNGGLTLNPDGSFVYTPNADFSGTDSFSYTAQDDSGAGNNQSAPVTVTITVNPTNDSPVADVDSYSVNEGDVLNVSVGSGVLANDTDADLGDTLSAVDLASETNGTVLLDTDGSFEFTPDADFNGTASFTYRAQDDSGDAGSDKSAVTLVSITVNPVNDPPTGDDDTFAANEDVTLTASAPGVLVNDNDIDGDNITAILNANASNGVVTLSPNGSFTYAPNSNFFGEDSFTYRVQDDSGAGNNQSAPVTVTINVAGSQDPPVVNPDTYNVNEDVTLTVGDAANPSPSVLDNDNDPDGDSLTVALVTNVSNGTLTLNPNGSFVYVPDQDFNGSDSFTYSVNDGNNPVVSGVVTISVNNSQDAPEVTITPQTYNPDEGDTITITAIGNDPDQDNTTLTYEWDLTGDGQFDNAFTSTINYLAEDGLEPSEVTTLTVRVTDDTGNQVTTTADVTIENVDPTITQGRVVPAQTLAESESINFEASATDPGGANDPLTYTWNFGDGSDPVTGANVSHIYADDGNFTATLTVTDDDGGEATRDISVDIANVPPGLGAITGPVTINEGSLGAWATTISKALNDDVTWSIEWGDGTLNTTGSLNANVTSGPISEPHTYTNNGTFTITITATDDEGTTAVQTFDVTVDNVNPTIDDITNDNNEPEGNTFDFSAIATDPGDDALTFTWNFGDGSPNGNGSSVSHVYTEDGVYEVSLEVTEPGGSSGPTRFNVTVLNANPSITSVTLPSVECTDSPAADNGCEGSSIVFEASATDPGGTNDPLVFTWNFGDGTDPVTGANPNHTYADNGTFTVTLTVDDDDGGSTSTQRTVTIENVSPSRPVFARPEDTTEGTEVTFNASSTDPGADTLVFTWNFGDGSPTQTGDSVTHTYADDEPEGQDDQYTVVVTVTDGDGGSDSRSRNITVNNANPNVEQITGDFLGDEGVELSYNATVSDPAGSNDTLTYTWDFGDGSATISGVNRTEVSNVYSLDGSYTLELTVTDEDGGSTTQTRTISIGGAGPVIQELNGTAVGDEGSTFSFTAQANEPGGDIVTYRWYFGDPAPPANPCVDPPDFEEIFPDANTPESEATYVYTDNRAYTVTLCAIDNDGTVSQTFDVTVNNVNPTISNINVPANGDEAASISFSASATDPGAANDLLTFTWDFGDGTDPVTGTSPSHVYADNGSYEVTLTVTDDDGGSATQRRSILIRNVDPTITSSSIPPTGDEANVVNFSATATDPGGANDPLTYTWNFGDGTLPRRGINLPHTYADDGTFTVTLIVEDDDGGTTSTTSEIVIGNRPPTISNLVGPNPGVEGAPFEFRVIASDPAGDTADPLNYIWNFGDGSPEQRGGNLDTITHVYTDSVEGTYTARVTVEDGDGGSISQTVEVTVNNVPPEIETFSITAAEDNATGPEGSIFRFQAFATDAGGANDPLTYTWRFGDSSDPVTGQNVTHIYRNNRPNNEPYTILLTVTDDDGGEITRSADVTVLNVAPILRVDTARSTDEGESLTFRVNAFDPGVFEDTNGNTPPNPDTLSYIWDMGDGEDPQTTTEPTFTYEYADDGVYTVTVTVEDTDGAQDQGTIPATIRNVNPTLSKPGPAIGFQGIPYEGTDEFGNPVPVQPEAVDPGGAEDPLIFTLRQGPPNMTIDPNTGVISWTPTEEQANQENAVFPIRVRVTDDEGGFGELAWEVDLNFTDLDFDNTPDGCETGTNGVLDPTDGCDGDGAAEDPENPGQPRNPSNTCGRIPSPNELDIDGDGVSNTRECIAGTNPIVSDAPNTPSISFPQTGDLVETAPPFVFAIFNSTDPNNDAISYDFELYEDTGDCGVENESPLLTGRTEGTSSSTTNINIPLDVDDLVENQYLEWRVRATDGFGFSPWTPCARFQYSRVNDAPSIPTPLSPNSNNDARTRAEFEATNSVDPDPGPNGQLNYEFEVYAQGADLDQDEPLEFSTISEDPSGTTSWRLSSQDALTENAFYTWRVRAIDTEGAASPWSTAEDFQVSDNNEPPETPTIFQPLDRQIFSSLEEVFFLTSVSNDNDNRPEEISYHFIIQADPQSNVCPAVNLDDSSLIPGAYIGDVSGQLDNLSPEVGVRLADVPEDNLFNRDQIFDDETDTLFDDTTFAWCVYAFDGRTFSAPARSTFRFSTSDDPPETVSLIAPANNSTSSLLALQFSWSSANDPEDDTVTYQLEIASDEPFSNVVFSSSNLTETREDGPTLLDNTNYWWRVRASDTNQAGPWSEKFSFFTNLSNQAPSIPGLLEPENGVVFEAGQTITFSWEQSSDPEGTELEYIFEIVPSREGIEAVFSATVEDNSDGTGTITLPENPAFTDPDRYSWSVRAVEVNGGKSSAWAPSRFFSIAISEPTEIPEPPAPEAARRPPATETCTVAAPGTTDGPVPLLFGLITLAAFGLRRRRRSS